MTTDMPKESIQIAKGIRQGLTHHLFSLYGKALARTSLLVVTITHAFHRFLKPIFWPVRVIRFAAPSTNDAASE
jgi:hypothetical protein